MLKKSKLTYKGMNQDISKSKRSPEFYFDANNVRILSVDGDTSGSITNYKGNVLIYTLPQSDQIIIGHAVLKEYLVLFSTNNSGIDNITRVSLVDYSDFLLYTGNLGFSTSHLIETEVYYESDLVQKVYWVDGLNQFRHINIITNSTYTDGNDFDAVPAVEFSQPYVSSIDYGGVHTAGMIQYAYNLIKKGGSQSAISPISELYPLDKNLGGGKVNEYVGKILNVTIDSVDTSYDIIRLYALKFTSYNESPVISVIAEELINNNSSFTFSDDGRTIRSISPEQFLFLGGTPIIPSTITSKYNRLILGNIKELYFDVPEDQFDARAFRFPVNSTTSSIKNSQDILSSDIVSSSGNIVFSTLEAIPTDHDCINTDFDTYNYQYNSNKIGATGSNIDIEIEQKSLNDPRNVLKSNEIYRFGIEFFNLRGQASPPKWICDLKTPFGNVSGLHNTLKVTIKNTASLSSLGVVGWRVLRVERTDADKTVICQGVVNPSVFQNNKPVEREVVNANLSKGVTYSNQGWMKLPSPFMRNLTNLEDALVSAGGESRRPKINRILHGNPICMPNVPKDTSEWPFPELMKHKYADSLHNSYEETRLFQFYSPEITFLNPQFGENLKYKAVASIKNSITDCANWGKQVTTENSYKYDVVEGELHNELRGTGVISLFSKSREILIKDKAEFNQNGLIGGAGGSTKRMNKHHYWRKYVYNSGSNTNPRRSISGSPSIIGLGESSKIYNTNTLSNVSDKYQYSNHLYTMVTDRNPGDADRVDDPIISINSVAAPCLNIVDSEEMTLESIIYFYAVNATDCTALVEIYRELSNQYGGNTYEARSRNSYLRIGKYLPISTTVNSIDMAGDVFVGDFKFERIVPNTTQILNNKYTSICEIVSIPVETTIDLSNRSDYSLDGWDGHFQPTFDEYHNYNRVYSQQPIFNRTTANPFTFEERLVFDNRFNATKTKVNGEIVDSWTDVLVNEEIYVDGKYGPVNKVIQNNDIVYFIQEQAIGILEVEPRVQTIATDGVNVELGRGRVLYNYRYINTNTGSVNPEAIFKSQNAVYFIDVMNKSINKIQGAEVIGLTDIHGLHSLMYNNLDYNTIKYSNSVNGCFDQVTNEAYFTTPNFTLVFNEFTDSFTNRYSFIPNRYIYSQYGLITSNNGNKLWKHGVGDYGRYYNTIYPSSITFVVAPEPDIDCVFNNIEYKSEVYSSGVDVPTKTLTSVRCWNEYLDSGVVNLTVGGNIKRKFRDWNFFIPRSQANILQRMRGQWMYMTLNFDNTNNEKLVLHDIVVSYDAVYKI